MTDCSSVSALRSQSIWMEQQALNKVPTCVLITRHTAGVCVTAHIWSVWGGKCPFCSSKPSTGPNVSPPSRLPTHTQLNTGRFNIKDQLIVSVHWAHTQMQGCHLQVDFPFTLYTTLIYHVNMLCIWLYMQKIIPWFDVQTSVGGAMVTMETIR